MTILLSVLILYQSIRLCGAILALINTHCFMWTVESARPLHIKARVFTIVVLGIRLSDSSLGL